MSLTRRTWLSVLLAVLLVIVFALPVVAESSTVFLPVVAGEAVGGEMSAAKAFTATSNTVEHFERWEYVTCALNGEGEYVWLEGDLHVMDHMTYGPPDSNGDFNFTIRSVHNPQGIRGYGLMTGDKYQGTGVTTHVTSSNTNVEGWPYVETYVQEFRLIGPGHGNNYVVHYLYHVTAHSYEAPTAIVVMTNIECK